MSIWRICKRGGMSQIRAGPGRAWLPGRTSAADTLRQGIAPSRVARRSPTRIAYASYIMSRVQTILKKVRRQYRIVDAQRFDLHVNAQLPTLLQHIVTDLMYCVYINIRFAFGTHIASDGSSRTNFATEFINAIPDDCAPLNNTDLTLQVYHIDTRTNLIQRFINYHTNNSWHEPWSCKDFTSSSLVRNIVYATQDQCIHRTKIKARFWEWRDANRPACQRGPTATCLCDLL